MLSGLSLELSSLFKIKGIHKVVKLAALAAMMYTRLNAAKDSFRGQREMYDDS
jgi:hypothetical protein